MSEPHVEHSEIWFKFAEVAQVARELAQITRYVVAVRACDGGWVISDLPGLYRIREHRLEEDAIEAADMDEQECADLMRDTSRDNYTEEDYTRRDLAAEAEEYTRYASSYD